MSRSYEAYRAHVAPFEQDRFGLFLHFGLYAIPARGEWVRNAERMPEETYEPFFREFDPRDCDMTAWARQAREAGMRYAVLTAKHHDGFCLFDSALTDYKSTNTPAHRDLVREFVDAFRTEGLKVGLYYSLLDWHHPDYPHYGDMHHPLRDDPAAGNEGRCFERYLRYMHGQVEELCRNYGKLDLMWFDFSYGDLRGEAWRAGELVAMVRRYQPQIILNNRLEVSGEGFGSLLTREPTEYSGDFVSPEQIIPPQGIRDELGRPVAWEACVTMNRNWGYCSTDFFYKPPSMLIRKLVECVSKGGNLILNVGPDARGQFPPQAQETLRVIGRWMRANGRAIFGCGASGLEKPEYGRITQCGNWLYYHVFEPQIGFIPLTGLKKEQIRRVRLLSTGAELRLQENWITGNYPELPFVSLGPEPALPDPIDTVIAVELAGAVSL